LPFPFVPTIYKNITFRAIVIDGNEDRSRPIIPSVKISGVTPLPPAVIDSGKFSHEQNTFPSLPCAFRHGVCCLPLRVSSREKEALPI
jgi:hypothetical protein